MMMVCMGASSENTADDKVPKRAVLMVHFGTTFDDTRAATIDALNARVRETFTDFTVAEAYTSRIIIDRLRKRGIEKVTPVEALLRLAADGYETVVIQGTNIIDGIETEVIRREALMMKPFFKDIRVGRPLLYSVEDGERTAGVLASVYAAASKGKSHVVMVGHGTSTPANAMYSQIDYMFGAGGNPNIHVATVEGYPTYDTTLAKLRAAGAREVTLVPFMFVAGDHARNDIAGEWKENLEKAGFKVTAVIEGLGQNKDIQSLYIDHIRNAIDTKDRDAVELKSAYIKENI